MNKTKIIFSALGVLAVIGSSLAFKANRTYGGGLRCSNITTAAIGATASSENCPFLTYIPDASGQKRYCTFASNNDADCVVMRVVLHQ